MGTESFNYIMYTKGIRNPQTLYTISLNVINIGIIIDRQRIIGHLILAFRIFY